MDVTKGFIIVDTGKGKHQAESRVLIPNKSKKFNSIDFSSFLSFLAADIEQLLQTESQVIK